MISKIIIGIVILLIIIGAGAFLFGRKNASQMQMNTTQTSTNTQESTQTAGKNTVTIQNMAFAPATLTVKVGDKVTWTNQDPTGHSATADDGSFDTGVLSQGQSGSVTFSKAGTYTYHCSIHPYMKGTIVVQ